jgi:N-acyl-D-aspartate/D-glutamate deacylase
LQARKGSGERVEYRLRRLTVAYDLIVKNGRVIDGSGEPGFYADVAVKDGKIAGIGKFNESATRVIDADGRVVSPGWIDNHTHYDAQAVFDPICYNSARNGHTTAIVGNCGLSIAPAREDDPDFVRRMFSGAERVPIDVLRTGVDVSWGPVSGYMSALMQNRGINVGMLIGHSAVRHYVMGDDYDRESAPEELEAMKQVVRDGMLAGALGVSFTTHRNSMVLGGEKSVPGAMASHGERMALAETLGDLGVGTIQKASPVGIGMERLYESLDFAIDASGRSGRPCSYNFILQREEDVEQQWRILLQKSEEAYHNGYRIYPMCLSTHREGQHFTFGLTDRVFSGSAINDLFGGLPTWSAVLSESQEKRFAAFSDADTRTNLRQEAASTPWNMVKVWVTQLQTNRGSSGKSIAQIANEQGKAPVDSFLDLVTDENLDTIFTLMQTSTDAAGVEEIMNSPCTTIGVSDGGAGLLNERFTYPATLLGYYVRERQALSLEKAVYKLTSQSASVFSITDRGLLHPGLAADITIFDPDTIAPLPTEAAYDLPGGHLQVKQGSAGIDYVIVNGESLVEGGEHTEALPGTVLKNALCH